MGTQDAHFGTLLDALNPNMRESQNWGIDISQHLEVYLVQLALENTAGTNFTEAALLLQNSAVIYTRKVDHLWNLTVQVLDNLQQSCHGKKKSVTAVTETDTSAEIEDQSEQPLGQKNKEKSSHKKYGPVNIDISDKSLEIALSNTQIKQWKLLPERYHLLCKGKAANQSKTTSSSDQTADERPKDPRYLLCTLALHHEMLEASSSECCANFNNESYNNSLGCDNLPDDHMSHHDDMEPPTDPDAAVDSGQPESAPIAEECWRADQAQNPRRENIVDAPPPTIEKDHWKTVPLDLNYPDSLIGKKLIAKLPNAECLENPITKRKQGLPLIRQFELKSLPKYLLHAIKPYPELDDELFSRSLWNKKSQSKPRSFAEIRHLLLDDLNEMTDFRGFEDYEPDPTEKTNGFLGFPTENEEGENEGHDCEDLPVNNVEELPDEDSIRGENDGHPLTLNVDLEAIALAQQPVAELDSNAAMTQRVVDWHNFVTPRLEAAQQRGHFDIHEYGTRILESLERRSEPTVTMHQLVENVDSQDVARYFLAALQLANTYNIEIQTPREELTVDRVDFTLLSTERHHEQLEDYVAPSREDSAAPICTSAVHYIQPNSSRNTQSPQTSNTLGKKRSRSRR